MIESNYERLLNEACHDVGILDVFPVLLSESSHNSHWIPSEPKTHLTSQPAFQVPQALDYDGYTPLHTYLLNHCEL